MAGISSKAAGKIQNNYLFNSKDKQAKEFSDGAGLEIYDFDARMQDFQVGRWWVIDPLASKPHNASSSPYCFVANNPIFFVDPDGKDRIEYTRTIAKDGTVLLKTQTTTGLYKSVWNNTYYGCGYATKNDYAVYTTHDLRSGQDVVTSSINTLHGSGHEEEVGIGTYLKIKVTGNDGDIFPKLPQLLVYGSGSEDPGWGTKADPTRPITVIDFAAFQSILSLIMIGMKVPDLAGADPKKIPEIVNKWAQHLTDKKNNEVLQCSSCRHFQKYGKNFDTTGKNTNPSDIIQIDVIQYHK